MMCEQARVALSARLDGEDPGVSESALAAHVGDCAGCRDWLGRAEQVTRMVRLQAVRVPDLTDRVLAAVAADRTPPGPRPGWTTTALRVAVAGVALVQLVLTLPELVQGFAHAAHEGASFDIAVAVGFLFAALRPRFARAYTPVALVLVFCLALTAQVDVAHSRVDALHELSHLATVAEAALLWALSRQMPAPRRDPEPREIIAA
jgi:predicted anti-sigma-YlaC factor YlaD